MSTESDRLQELQEQLEAVLEERITNLLTTVKATQAVSARIAATQADIHRNEQLQATLKSDLKPLESDNDKLKRRADQLRDKIANLRKQRKDLIGQVKGLAAEAKSAGEG